MINNQKVRLVLLSLVLSLQATFGLKAQMIEIGKIDSIKANFDTFSVDNLGEYLSLRTRCHYQIKSEP